jgi:hypothetical protein
MSFLRVFAFATCALAAPTALAQDVTAAALQAELARASGKNAGDFSQCTLTANCYLPSQDLAIILIDPTGNYIGGEPIAVEENDHILLAMVGMKDEVEKVEFEASCEAPPPIRISSPQGGDGAVAIIGEEETPIRIVRAKRFGPCAPPGLKWALGNSKDGKTTTQKVLETEPVYRIGLGLALGFSTVKKTTLSIAPLDEGGGRIVSRLNETGPKQLVIANVFLCPRNVKRSAWREWSPVCPLTNAISPAVGIDVANLSTNLAFGLNLEVAHGLNFVALAHLHRDSVLDEASGLSVGATTQLGADQLPTQETWRTGAFFGFNLTASTAAELLKTVAGMGK